MHRQKTFDIKFVAGNYYFKKWNTLLLSYINFPWQSEREVDVTLSWIPDITVKDRGWDHTDPRITFEGKETVNSK